MPRWFGLLVKNVVDRDVVPTSDSARSYSKISKWQNVYTHWCDGTWPVGCIQQADGTKGYSAESTLLGTESKYLVAGHKLRLFNKNCALGTGYQRLNEVGYVQQPRKRTKTNASGTASTSATSRTTTLANRGLTSQPEHEDANGAATTSPNNQTDIRDEDCIYKCLNNKVKRFKMTGHFEFVPLSFGTIKQAVKYLLLDLLPPLSYIRESRLHPHPRIAPVIALIAHLENQKQAQDELTCKDKGINGIIDQYDIAEDSNRNVFWWGLPLLAFSLPLH
ncbi:hypothetical protein DFS34DRAFT_70160 [Phlyctochytrium arcticum]|nr:hypothetical protein DFS34DRAFT_70160 [Phlyctochytrium arcticum]